MGFDFRMENNNTEQIIEDVHDRTLVALDAAGLQAATLSKRELQKSPERIDTGLLRNSITHAVSGKPAAIGGYHASKGSNRYIKGKNKGKRRSANAKNAGAVGMGFYSGNAPQAPSPDKPSVYVGTNVEYAIYVHEGTLHMKANRFIANAMRTNGAELGRIIAKVLSDI